MTEPVTEGTQERMWVEAGTTADLAAAGKLVVEHGDTRILLLWNDGAPTALNDTCIHKGRSLSQGFLLNGRIVCPGHQWAFEVGTGYCRERDKSQPSYAVRVAGDLVEVAVPASEGGEARTR